MLTKNKRLFRFDSCLTLQNSFFFSFDVVFLLYRFRFFSLYVVFLLYRFRRFFSLDFLFLLYRFHFISLDFVFLLYRFRFISFDFVFLLYRFRWILFSFCFVSFLFVSQFTGTHIIVRIFCIWLHIQFTKMIELSLKLQTRLWTRGTWLECTYASRTLKENTKIKQNKISHSILYLFQVQNIKKWSHVNSSFLGWKALNRYK